MKEKLIALLTFTSSLKSFGMKFIRVAILVVFVWIGGLKYFHYEADGIVPFVANSPFMSFFYAKGAPEYKEHKNAEDNSITPLLVLLEYTNSSSSINKDFAPSIIILGNPIT